jgi:serpin B
MLFWIYKSCELAGNFTPLSAVYVTGGIHSHKEGTMGRCKICLMLITLILIGFVLMTVAGCAKPPGDAVSTPGDASIKVLQSEVQRETSPDVPTSDLEELVAGNSAFALDFYQAVRERGGNLFFSPYSLSVALAMTYAGARENTEAQMADTLNFSLPQDRLHPAFNALDLEITETPIEPSQNDEKVPFQLSIANSLWGQEGYPFIPEFLDLLAKNYGAGMHLEDFINDPEGARIEINDWVARETNDRIKDLIPEGAINDLTRIVLANAIYFKADWVQPFSKELTRDQPFNTLDQGQIMVPMMSHDSPENMNYYAGPGFQAVELPYVGDKVSMVLLVPEVGGFSEFEADLDSALFEEILANLEPKRVSLTMPKFSFDSKYDLAGTLSGMGMPDAFTSGVADFSGMDGTLDLFISDVFHKAFVAVDEKGTEAAAATAVIMELSSAVMQDVVLTVDRPFIFLIRERQTGTILFLGRVLNPLE